LYLNATAVNWAALSYSSLQVCLSQSAVRPTSHVNLQYQSRAVEMGCKNLRF